MSRAFTRAKLSADRIDIRHADGRRETLKDGVYRFQAKRGEDERRIATEDDVARLLEIGGTADVQIRRLADGSEWMLTPRFVKVSYADGSEEMVKGEAYEARDAEGRETERPATDDDRLRLEALAEAALAETEDDKADAAGPKPERGGRRDNDMTGDDGDDAIAAGSGDDRVRGGGGNDEIAGGAGRDRLRGGDGDDEISGGDGRDRLHGGAGDDALSGGDGDDRLRGDEGADRLSGGAGRDRLDGGGDGDLLDGGADNDRLAGGKGDDLLDGGAGRDRLKGGQGDDVLTGGGGNDRLWGQGGADRFVFAPAGGDDRIHGFEIDKDVLDLTAFGFSAPFDLASIAARAGDGLRLTFDGTASVRLDDIALDDLAEVDILI